MNSDRAILCRGGILGNVYEPTHKYLPFVDRFTM